MILPKQLQNLEFRFVLIKPYTKVPYELRWQEINNYQYNDKKILTHKSNLGIVCGYGGLVILDIDNIDYVKEFDEKLNTFSVVTGSGGKHYYLICEEKFQKNYYVLKDKVGELRVANSQVVCPGSVHPNGNKYKVVNDVEIKKITKLSLKRILGVLLDKAETIDTSRSGIEWGEVCSMVEGGYSFDDCDKEMRLFGHTKWIEAGLDYRLYTYCSALKQFKRREKKQNL